MTAHTQTPRLIVVTDRKHAALPLPDMAREALLGGADVVQVREKDLSTEHLLVLVSEVLNEVGDPRRIMVNGNVEVARDLKVGLHLPELGTDRAAARRQVLPDRLLGQSIHGVELMPDLGLVDFVIAGHVYPSRSKPGKAPLGLEGLKRILESTSIPVIGIGGIDATNAADVIAAGASGVAVISAINNSKDPASAAAEIRRLFDDASPFSNRLESPFVRTSH